MRVTRRSFLGRVLAAAGACVAPSRAFAQSTAGKLPRIGILSMGARTAPHFVGFEQRLAELGWIDGRTVTIDQRTPEYADQLPALATDVVRAQPTVIVAGGPEAPLKAILQATTTTPVVMVAINYDPIARGYVAGLARPGGRVTGIFYRQLEVGPKQLELFKEALPGVRRVAVLWESFAADQVPPIESAARTLGLDVEKVEVPPPWDVDAAFGRLKALRIGGVLVAGSPIFFRERAKIAELALRHRLPTVSSPAMMDAGLLLGYGPNLTVLYRRAAEYVDRILRGATPDTLPVEQPTEFEFIVNRKTARALGLTLPPVVLQRADRVIE